MTYKLSAGRRAARDGNRAGAETITRILDVAENLFAERGFAETSQRDVTQAAGANIAAINYHFGSKEGLYAAVLDRLFGPVLSERMEALSRLEAAQQETGMPPSVEALLASWIDPLLDAFYRSDGRGRLILDLELQVSRSIERLEIADWPLPFADYRRQFRSALARSASGLAPDVAAWRAEFICSCVLPTLRSGPELHAISDARCDVSNRASFRAAWMSAGLSLLSPL